MSERAANLILVVCFSMIGALFVFLIVTIILDDRDPDRIRRTVRWRGQVKRCVLEYPTQANGKVSEWRGVILLSKCADGQDVAGATDVEILK